MLSTEEALSKLSVLSSEEIARLFYDQKITGILGSPSRCPVAKYLNKHTGKHFTLVTHAREIDERSRIAKDDRHALPESVSRFMLEFDNYIYPYLIKEDTWTS